MPDNPNNNPDVIKLKERISSLDSKFKGNFWFSLTELSKVIHASEEWLSSLFHHYQRSQSFWSIVDVRKSRSFKLPGNMNHNVHYYSLQNVDPRHSMGGNEDIKHNKEEMGSELVNILNDADWELQGIQV